VRLDAPALGPPRELPWREVAAYARRARVRWQDYAARPSAAAFAALRGDDPAHLVQVALGEAAGFLGEADGPPIDLAIATELPVGSGFGSSAAVAVAVVAGYLALRSAPAGFDDVEALALEVERRQHGLPSGVDTAAVLHGGLVWAEPAGLRGALAFSAFTARSPLLARLAVYDTGRPPEPTGAVVAAVRARLEADPARGRALLDRIEEATRGLAAELAAEAEDPERVRAHFGAGERALEELGVVPAPAAAVVRAVEAAGGAAKISGAGSLAGPGAGSLLAYHPRPEVLAELPELAALRRLAAPLGVEGLRLTGPERAEPGEAS
jgi:mevalonate kinase